jgi:tetratricopeptide (TPR) repeat protein
MIFCQRCGTQNQIGEEICLKCGTKLMIMSYAHRLNSNLPILDEHFLERISALEYTMGRLDERLNQIYDLVQQLTTDSFYDHTMIESIAGALKRLQLVGKRDLERDWHKRLSQRLLESEERERFEASKKSFLNAFRGKDKGRFSRLIEEGSQHFLRKNYRRGLRALEQAFSADPQNCEIGIFLGRIYYEFENFVCAGKCLERVLKNNPHHFEANLLTGLMAKRRGDFATARRFLVNAVDICQTSLAAHVFLGSVLVSLGEDKEALGHFSCALNLKPSPQMYLMVGSIYSRQGQLRYAIKHMKKAIEMDPGCDEAFFQLGLAFLEQNWTKKARECIQTAAQLNPKESRYKDALELFLDNRPKLASLSDWKRNPILNEESMEFLVKDELRLTFRRDKADGRTSGKDAEGK